MSQDFKTVEFSGVAGGGSVAPCLTRMFAAYRQPRSAFRIFEDALSLRIDPSGSNLRIRGVERFK